MFDLATRDIKFISGVGPQKAAVLNKELEIYSLHDLIYYFPYKYIDRSRIYYIHEIDGNMPYIQLKGEILGFETIGEGRQRRLTAHFSDGTGVVDLVWFQGIKYILGKYKLHEEYIIFGKPTVFNGRINVAHPDVDKPDDLKLSSVGLQPYYSTTEKMKRSFLNSHAIEKMMATVIQQIQEPLPETLSPKLLTEHHLMPLTEALWNIHFPTNPDVLRRAQYRLKFEELFYVQLNILRYAKDRQKRYRGYIFEKVGDVFNTFYTKNLPFQLTGAQKRVLKEIRNDVGSGRQMNRLLQGDVGSGKTLVALMSMLLALDNGYQACMMAPTEILANQHYETIKELLFGMDIRVELLTGSIKGKRREAILTGLLTGDVKILIGTHAVIEDTVNFSSLGFVVIDEQHRFGVAQRARLWSKNVQPPHVLVMTATPIPRTLAMTLYGDLDVSVIDELPPGRKPITTIHQFDNRRESMYRSVRKQIDEGRQVYIVYPLIKESEKIDLKNLEEGYQHILEEFPKCTVCKVHGKMKPAEKDEQMQLFVSGKAQIMVATTVIEWLVEQIGDLLRNNMAEGPFKDLLIDGIIGGVGAVIVFLPNILILYFCISLMEDSGYMARAAFIMDKIMHKMGLHGKSFIPLIMGFGCNVPAIIASRTIENRKSRLITMLVNPLMSCSARLPIYLLLVGAFFPNNASLVLLSIYVIGIVLAVVMARLFSKFLVKGDDTPFVMELPPYRMPTAKSIFRHTWEKGAQYLKKMGGIIMIASIIIWFLGYYPNHDAYETVAEQQENSYIGQLGRGIEPVIKPLGFDWKLGIGLLSGVGAKELVVSTLGVLYADDPDADSVSLAERIPITPLVAFCYMLFVLIYFPCIAAIAAIKQESGSWKWTLFAACYTTGLAWLVSFAVYQIGGLFV